MVAYWGVAAHSAYDMFSWYKFLNVIFPPFPDHCLLLPFQREKKESHTTIAITAAGVAALKVSPYIIHSADCIFLLDNTLSKANKKKRKKKKDLLSSND